MLDQRPRVPTRSPEVDAQGPEPGRQTAPQQQPETSAAMFDDEPKWESIDHDDDGTARAIDPTPGFDPPDRDQAPTAPTAPPQRERFPDKKRPKNGVERPPKRIPRRKRGVEGRLKPRIARRKRPATGKRFSFKYSREQ